MSIVDQLVVGYGIRWWAQVGVVKSLVVAQVD